MAIQWFLEVQFFSLTYKLCLLFCYTYIQKVYRTLCLLNCQTSEVSGRMCLKRRQLLWRLLQNESPKLIGVVTLTPSRLHLFSGSSKIFKSVFLLTVCFVNRDSAALCYRFSYYRAETLILNATSRWMENSRNLLTPKHRNTDV